MEISVLTLSTTLLASYIAVLAVLSWLTYTKDGSAGYIIGDRKLGVFSTTSSMLAGQFNGGGVFFTFTFALMVGYGLLWFALGFLLGYILLSIFAKTVNKEGKDYNDVNAPDILNRRIGNYTQHFASFIIVGKVFLFGTAQLLIAGTVIAALLGISNGAGIWMTAVIIGAYLYLGGYLTVVRTDIIQWFILFALALLAALFLPKPTLTEIAENIGVTPDHHKLGFVLFTFMLILSNADVWQRIMSSSSEKVATVSLRLSGVLFMVFIFAMVLIVKSWGIETEQKILFFELFKHSMLSPVTLSVLGMFTLISVMSTIDTQIQLFSSALSKNVLRIDLTKERDRFIKTSRIATIALLIVIATVASSVGSTMEFILKAFSFAYILAPIMIISMIWGKSGDRFKDMTCVIALSVGLAIYTYMFFSGHFNSMINNVIPSAVTSVICLGGFATYHIKRSVKIA